MKLSETVRDAAILCNRSRALQSRVGIFLNTGTATSKRALSSRLQLVQVMSCPPISAITSGSTQSNTQDYFPYFVCRKASFYLIVFIQNLVRYLSSEVLFIQNLVRHLSSEVSQTIPDCSEIIG